MDSDAGHMGDKSKLTYVIPQAKQWQCSVRSARDLDASISRVFVSATVMAATPPRPRWDTKSLSPSFLNSPDLEGSTESYISTSSLEYVNAQLVAHGFASSQGLSLDGLSGTDSNKVVKCLLCMLSQRVVCSLSLELNVSS